MSLFEYDLYSEVIHIIIIRHLLERISFCQHSVDCNFRKVYKLLLLLQIKVVNYYDATKYMGYNLLFDEYFS